MWIQKMSSKWVKFQFWVNYPFKKKHDLLVVTSI